MDINQLRYFVSVSQTLSFTEAANKHYITQPAISHQINNLEKELGVKLLLRTSHSVKLTKAGKEFFPYAVEVLEKLQAAGLRMKRLSEGHAGYVKLSGVISSAIIISRCVAAYSKTNPDVQFDITLTSPYEEQIRNYEEFDFNFVPIEMLPVGEIYQHIETYRDKFNLVVPKGHYLLSETLDFSKLGNIPFVTVSEISAPVLYMQIMAVCKSRNYAPNIVNFYNRAEAVLLSVSAGVGIAVLPESISKTFLADKVDLIPIEGEDSERTSVAFWNKEMNSTAAQKFKELIFDMFPQK